jgi:hypothetical protein
VRGCANGEECKWWECETQQNREGEGRDLLNTWTGVSVRECANGDEEGASLYRPRRACGEESISPIGDTVRWTWNIPRIIPSTTKGASAPQHVRPSVRPLVSTRHVTPAASARPGPASERAHARVAS